MFFSRNWEAISKILQSYPKCKTEDGQAEVFHRGMGKRRASHQSSEHDLEEQITEWANMTWFLLALGGVCLQRPRSLRVPINLNQNIQNCQSSQSNQNITNNPINVHSHPNNPHSTSNQSMSHNATMPLNPNISVSLGSLAQNSVNSVSSSVSSGRGSLHPSTISLVTTTIVIPPPQEIQYCPVTQ